MKKLLLVSVLLLAAIPAFARMGMREERGDYVPQVVLVSPTKETADIAGKENLTFKWSSHESTSGIREYYDFRLYKGYDMLEGALIMKEKVDPNVYSIDVKSEMFDNGEAYTWSMRQVYDGVRKSERSYASFKVIKK